MILDDNRWFVDTAIKTNRNALDIRYLHRQIVTRIYEEYSLECY